MPAYLALCLRTIERNSGVPVTLLSASDIEELAPRLNRGLAAKVPRLGQRSDYYRSCLLASVGGMWLDVDTVVLKDLNWAFDGAQETGAGLRPGRLGVGTTPLVASVESPVLLAWIALQERVMQDMESGDDLQWNSLGASLLSEALSDEIPFFQLSRDRVAPLDWSEAGQLTNRFLRPEAILTERVSMVNLYNERFPSWLKKAGEDDIMRSKTLLSRLLRIALGQSALEDERYPGDAIGAFTSRGIEHAHQVLITSRRRALRGLSALSRGAAIFRGNEARDGLQ